MRNLKLMKFFYIIFFTITIILNFHSTVFAHQKPLKHVLILNSSDKFVNRSENLIDSLMPILKASPYSLNIHTEYMNIENFKDTEYIKNLYAFYNKKFFCKSFDLVISIDTAALNFLKKYSKSLFPNTPIVFTGVSNVSKDNFNDLPMFTGIVQNEFPLIDETIDISLSLNKHIENIIIPLGCSTPPNTEIKNYIRHIADNYKYKRSLNFLYLDDLTKLQDKSFINKYKNNSILLLLNGFTTSYSNSIFLNNNSILTSDDFFIPVYSIEETFLNYGVLGGKVHSSKFEGTALGNLALKILNGSKPKDFPIINQYSSQYTFDYNMLKKYNIPITSVPKDSLIINLKPKSYNLSKLLIWLFVSFIITLLCILVINLFQKHTARNALIESEKRLRILINAFPDLICLKDGDGHWLEINKSTIKFFNLRNINWKTKTTDQIIDMIPNKYFCQNKLKKYKHFDELALRKKTLLNYQDEFILDNTEKIILDIFKVPIFDSNGDCIGIVTIGHDLTSHIKAEENNKLLNEMLEYQKLRVEFFANISHELKTPLNLILSAVQYVELVQNKNVHLQPQESQKYTDIIKQNSYRLVRIVNNILDITKFDSGYFQIHPENYNIVEMIEDICLYCASYIHSKDLDFIFDTDTEEKIISCDPLIMERIILNLLSNAIKFTNPGGKITVNIYDKDTEIKISVKDTGIGIPENKQDLIFERFVQVDKSFSRSHEGSGVGLSLVKAFIDLHGGSIGVKSKVNCGSEFIITLPITTESSTDVKIYSDVTPYEFRSEKINIEFSDIY